MNYTSDIISERKRLFPDNLSSPASPFGRKEYNATNKKHRLFKNDKTCCYCGRTTIIHQHRVGIGIPYNSATIEHRFSKNDIRRALSNEFFLACYACNQRKNETDQMQLWQGYEGGYTGNNISIIEILKNGK